MSVTTIKTTLPTGGREHVMPAGYACIFYSKLGRKSHVYLADWHTDDEPFTPLAGVSSVTKCADDGSTFSKGAWWGMGIGAEGTRDLIEYRDVKLSALQGLDRKALSALLSEHKLSTNHVRDTAGNVGTTIHKAIESYFRTSHLPNPDDYNEAVQPKLRGAIKYLTEKDPEPIHTEIVVCSRTHACAGTLDLYCLEDGKPALRDFKSGSYLPLEHGIQLGGYEGLGQEAGYLPAMELDRAVVQLLPDDYKIHRPGHTFDDFLAYLACYRISKR